MSVMPRHDHIPAARPLLIVFSHLRWDFVYQRPQHLLGRAARDFDICFIEEPLFDSNASGFREIGTPEGVCVIQPLLADGVDHQAAIEHQCMVARTIAARAGTRPLYLWFYTPMALAFARDISADLILFDKMDELSAFDFAPPELHAAEADLMARADLVFTGGASLQRVAEGRNPEVHCFPSSIDAAHFGQARTAGPADPHLENIPHPRIGFFGVIDERIDQPLIAAVAALRPDWQFIMIGPTAKIDPAQLPNAPNIHWLGMRGYAELPSYMAHWDLGWMPFARNSATRFISPTKTPEFLAAGLPLMSTSITDVVEPYGRLGLVQIADEAAAMVAAGDRLLAANDRTARLAAVDARLEGNSWDTTWAAMRALIHNAAAPSARSAAAPATREVMNAN
ncbi:glycosyl transferase [Polymorphobacter glacialis]|uniref:Glycosyl transferase n=1 Tax=Sandarakinorhabdus glacialis TaxID=1614636 RepID=A0A917E8A0_9SPHN|nr:glycosyltransferase [Polymorphobacter glacialis]GGE13921.1 glycosyl transferase [Polymorphobacter glacialis]